MMKTASVEKDKYNAFADVFKSGGNDPFVSSGFAPTETSNDLFKASNQSSDPFGGASAGSGGQPDPFGAPASDPFGTGVSDPFAASSPFAPNPANGNPHYALYYLFRKISL